MTAALKLYVPPWLAHRNDKLKREPIYSVHVSGDGSRIATGGIGSKKQKSI